MAHTIQRLDLDNQQLSLDNNNLLTINKGNTLQLPLITSISALQSFTNDIALFDGSTWVKKSGDRVSNGNGGIGTIIRVNSSNYWERNVEDGKHFLKWFLIDADYTLSYSIHSKINNLISYLVTNNLPRKIVFPSGRFYISSTININDSGFEIEGQGSNPYLTDKTSTNILYQSNGVLFELGTFDGLPEENNSDNGVQGITIKNIYSELYKFIK